VTALRYPDHTPNESVEGLLINLCEDCVMAHAGNDTPDAQFETCPEWEGWDFESVYADDDTERYYEPLSHFSKVPCDGCHSTLYGTHYDHVAVRSMQQSESVIRLASQPDTVNR